MRTVGLIGALLAVFGLGFGAAYYLKSSRAPTAETQAEVATEADASRPAEVQPAPATARTQSASRPARTSSPQPRATAAPSQESRAAARGPEPSVQPEATPASAPAATVAARSLVLPAGTTLEVSLLDSLSSEKNKAGDVFEATLNGPVVLEGEEVIPKYAKVWGEVAHAVKSGRLKERAELHLRLTAIQLNGRKYEITTSTLEEKEGSKTKRDVIAMGGGAGIGAAIGGAAGGGKGAGIGAAIGAGAGTAAAAMTGKRDIKFPPETLLRFRLREPLTLR